MSFNLKSHNYTLKNGQYKAKVASGKYGLSVSFVIGKNEVAFKLCGSAPRSANTYAKAFIENKIVPDTASLMFGTVGIFEIQHIETQG